MRTVLILLCLLPLAAVPVKRTAADEVRAWLAFVDSGAYEKSYDATAAFFRSDMKRAQWTESLNGFRKPFGKVKKRTERSQTKKKSLPGAPAGDYVIFTFDTVFESTLTAVETVNTVKEKDGVRVCGYFIR
ncbi:MAG: DUF4019 domain-containing protein [Spirochaetota bacterium]